MDEVILFLLKKNAHAQHVRITTTEMGKMLGMSQQNASRRISQLEKAGMIAKSAEGISLTKKGMEDAHSLYSDLKSALEKKSLEILGTIIAGMGEGKYYMSIPEYKKQIMEKLGFAPYEGTLNIRLSAEEAAKKSAFLKNAEPIVILGFKKQGRTFGDLFAYPCRVEKTDCALIIPLRTHHPSEIIEIISSVNLKKTLGRKDGDEIRVELK